MPRRLLLSQSQVSVVLFTVIVCLLTSVVFLFGVVIQQKTVRTLHTTIKPRTPIPIIRSETSSSSEKDWKLWWFGKAAQKLLGTAKVEAPPFVWSQYAFAQLVHNREEVCSAIILFSQLNRHQNPVPRLLVFPHEWASEEHSGNVEIKAIQKMLKKATRRYKVILVPMTRKPADERLTSTVLFALEKYDKVMTLPVPGVVVNPDVLSTILATSPSDVTAMAIPPCSGADCQNLSAILVRPSQETYNSLNVGNVTLSSFLSPSPVSTSDTASTFASNASLTFATSASLRTSTSRFNVSAFEAETGYVHLLDPNFYGPEIDTPYEEIVKARPRDLDRGFTWERMESTYKDMRFRVCGMDLLEWNERPEFGEALNAY